MMMMAQRKLLPCPLLNRNVALRAVGESCWRRFENILKICLMLIKWTQSAVNTYSLFFSRMHILPFYILAVWYFGLINKTITLCNFSHTQHKLSKNIECQQNTYLSAKTRNTPIAKRSLEILVVGALATDLLLPPAPTSARAWGLPPPTSQAPRSSQAASRPGSAARRPAFHPSKPCCTGVPVRGASPLAAPPLPLPPSLATQADDTKTETLCASGDDVIDPNSFLSSPLTPATPLLHGESKSVAVRTTDL